MITYKILENKELKDDVLFSQAGKEHEFTASAVKDNVKDLLKKKTEMGSQIKLESAKIENIVHFNEFIKGLSEEQCHAVYMYQQSLSIKNMCERKLEEINEALKEIDQAVLDIKEQTGYELDISLPPIELTVEDLKTL